MPTVQKYGDARKVVTAALPGARRTAAATALSEGAGVAQAEEQRALVVARIGEGVRVIGQRLYAQEKAQEREEAEKERQRAIRVNVADGQNKLSRAVNDIMWNQTNGAMNTRGEAALGQPEQVNKAFDQAAASIAETMGTPEAKAAFEEHRLREGAAVDLQIQRHTSDQIQTYQAGVMKSRIANGVEEAVRNNTTLTSMGTFDIDAGRKSLNDAIEYLKQQGPGLGLSQAQIDEQILAMKTRVHENTIDIYAANGNMAAAKAYFEEMNALDQISTDRVDDIEKTLRAGGVKKEAQEQTEKIVGKFGTGEEAIKEAKKIKDADVQDEVVNRIEVEHARQERQKREKHSELLITLAQKVRATGAANFTPTEMRDLTPDEHENLRTYARNLAGGIPIKTNKARWYALRKMANEQPEEFAKLNLVNDINNLSDADFQEMGNLQAHVQEGNQKAANEALSGYKTQAQIVDGTIQGLGMDPSPKEGTAAFTAVANIKDAVDQQVQAWKAEHPRETISSDEIRRLTDDMMKTIVLKPGGWGNIFPGGEPFYDVTKRIGLITLDDMTPEDKAEATRFLTERKRRVTPEAILNVHRAYLARTAKPKAK